MAIGMRVQLADGRCGTVTGVELHYTRWCDVRLDSGAVVWTPAYTLRAC